MASESQPYNELTLQLFEKPIHAGDLKYGYTDSTSGEGSESASGARVRIAVGLRNGMIVECRFRAFGCPHLIAACEWLCRQHEGGPLADLTRFRIADCMQTLAVPVEKTGRLLLLEDAIRSLTAQIRAK